MAICGKCQKQARTTLVTPAVKKKSELYYGSPASPSNPPTLGQTGVVKSKLLSKSAKNPMLQYQSSCVHCKTRVAQGYTYCNTCAYRMGDACPVCGKAKTTKAKSAPLVITGQKYTLK